MARKSNEAKVRELAQTLGIEVTAETLGFDGVPTVEVWSYGAHLSEGGNPTCHTMFGHGDTWPKAWADALWQVQDLKPCPDDCGCRQQ